MKKLSKIKECTALWALCYYCARSIAWIRWLWQPVRNRIFCKQLSKGLINFVYFFLLPAFALFYLIKNAYSIITDHFKLWMLIMFQIAGSKKMVWILLFNMTNYTIQYLSKYIININIKNLYIFSLFITCRLLEILIRMIVDRKNGN